MKKGIAFAIIFLFIGVAFAPSISSKVEQSSKLLGGDILYVGGDGPGNYTRIQDAINDAEDGDTVFVYNGTYFERIDVDKSINLTGENKEITVIDGMGPGVTVKLVAEGVNLSGFTITNGMGIGIWVWSSNNIIFDNIIDRNANGISFRNEPTDYNIIRRNIISNCEFGGISLWYSHYCQITENIIFNCGWTGISIYFCEDNTISGNIISQNLEGGISLAHSTDNVVYRNTIRNNLLAGLWLFWGGEDNVISENNFILNLRRNAIFFSSTSETPFNIWERNYWGRPRILPKIIIGYKERNNREVPCINVDWRPSLVPYIVPPLGVDKD